MSNVQSMTSMEINKQSKLKNKILKILPKAVSAFTFQNPSFSPGRTHQTTGRGFSGPIVSIIPDEARRKKKGESLNDDQEPTSPKVSCMGKIKNKKKINNNKDKQQQQQLIASQRDTNQADGERKKTSNLLKIFNIRAKSKNKKEKMKGCSADDHNEQKKVTIPDKVVPGLGQMKRFTSVRRDQALGNFDWAAQIAPLDSDHRSYYSDEDQGRVESGDDIEDDDEDYRITFSAPIVRGGGHLVMKPPKKEVNLWKRRTMDPPRPLQLNPTSCQD